jgi:hypothetical protein
MIATLVAGAVAWAPADLSAQSSLIEGVSYRSTYFELVKKVGVAARASVIHPDEVMTDGMRAAQDGEATSAMQVLSGPLDRFMATLVGPECPNELVRGAILDYEYLRPMDESPARGRMYVMYVGELYWPFPAPLLADILRLRVTWDTPHVVRDLLTSLLMRWGRDHIQQPPSDAGEMPRLKVAALLDELRDSDLEERSWKTDQAVQNLLRRTLTPPEIAAVEEIARAGGVRARVGALKILGVGGWVKDVKLYAAMLADKAPEVQRGAFWALLALGDKAALKAVKEYPGRKQAVAARLQETHATVSAPELEFETATLDWLIAAALGTNAPRPAAPAQPSKPVPEPRAPDGLEEEPPPTELTPGR